MRVREMEMDLAVVCKRECFEEHGGGNKVL